MTPALHNTLDWFAVGYIAADLVYKFAKLLGALTPRGWR